MFYYRDPENGRTDRQKTSDYLFVCSTGINAVGPRARIHTDYTVLRPEGRQDYHILYVTEGYCDLTYEGEVYRLRVGDFALYSPGQPQQYTLYCQEQNAYYWVHFKGVGAAGLLQELGLCGGVYRSPENDGVLSALGHLMREFHLKRKGYRPCSASWLSLLLCRLARTQEAPTTKERERQKEIYDIAAAISEDPGAALSLDEYAIRMHLGRDRFVHLFREVMNEPPHHYIQNAKLAAARRLLRESDLHVREIANALGYDDPLYFSRLFQRAVGVSPREYRSAK